MSKKKAPYGELERTKDQLTIATYIGLKEKLRAANMEAQYVSQVLNQSAEQAQAAEQRLTANTKK